jgi:SAM-dependent methyltransferase
MPDRIELLSESLIDQHPDLALEVLAASSRLSIPLGWHYLLDLIWILRELDGGPKRRILEVGAGLGLLQFILADLGHEVTSVDMRVRQPSRQLSNLYSFKSIGSLEAIDHAYLQHHGLKRRPSPGRRLGSVLDTKLGDLPKKLMGAFKRRPAPGADTRPVHQERPVITFIRSEVEKMKDLAAGSFDVTLSVSALEHNEPEHVARIGQEIARVTRSRGLVLHTVSACLSGRAFHAPSHSHLLDEDGLVAAYQLKNYTSNFSEGIRIERELREGKRLRRWLAHTYFQSGSNGMPWGIWDPQYLPVGVRKEL